MDLPTVMPKSCAYNREYLPRARAAMGAMLDYAVWDVKMDIDEYFGCSGKCGTVSGGMRLGWLRKVA